jgi:hypothetical protein
MSSKFESRGPMGDQSCLLHRPKTVKFSAFLAGVLAILLLCGGVDPFSTGVILPVKAQGVITVSRNKTALNFPETLQFQLTAAGPARITRVELTYGTNAQSCQSLQSTRQFDFKPDTSIGLDWIWNFRQSKSLPPGAKVWWQWTIEDEAGNKQETERQTLTIEDDSHTWQNLNKGTVTVYWAEGKKEFGARLLDEAVRSLDRLANDTGARLSGDIRLTIYPSTESLSKAVLHLPDWAGGVASSEYGSILLAIEPGEYEWARASISHELAHLVFETLTGNCVGVSMPTWFNEGLAVFAEGPASVSNLNLVNNAQRNKKLPPLNSLVNGFSTEGQDAAVAYAQSGQVMGFLIQKYGSKKLTALVAAIREGTTFDAAMQQIYGFDTDGLDRAWRASKGYAVASASPTVGSGQAAGPSRTPVPTMALWTQAPYVSATPTTSPTSPATPSPIPASSTPEPTLGAAALPAPTTGPAAGLTNSASGGQSTPGISIYIMLGVFLLLASAVAATVLFFRQRTKKSLT